MCLSERITRTTFELGARHIGVGNWGRIPINSANRPTVAPTGRFDT